MNTNFDVNPNEFDYLKEIRHKIHSRPCLSGNEKETADIIAEELEKCSPDKLWRNIGGHGMIAMFKGKEEGPSVLFRCELDALPIKEAVERPYMSKYDGIAHCCGHDGHMAIMCGLASWIAANREKLLEKGCVYLLFQPEEETGSGAEKMARWMKENGMSFDYAFALHNWPGFDKGNVIIYPGTYAWASTGLRMDITGHTAHASEPWEAANPTAAITEIIKTINSFDRETSFSTIVGVRIGDEDYGITPGWGFVAATVRSQTDEGLDILKNKIISSATQIVEKQKNLKMVVSETDYFPATLNSEGPTSLVRKTAREAGYQTLENNMGTRGSDDFVHIAKMARKGATFFDVGCGKNHAQLHRPDFDFEDEILPVGLDIMRRVCLQILQSQQAGF